jgi:CHASE2 domain-containing sensor protein
MVPVLGEAVHDSWGILEGQPTARRVRLGAPVMAHVPESMEVREEALVPSFALRTVMQVEAQRRTLKAVSAAVDRRDGQIRLRDENGSRVRSIPLPEPDLNLIVALAHRHDLEPDPYFQVLANSQIADGLSRFKNKIIVIGFARPEDRWELSGAGERYGVELQASAISNLLQNVYIRPLRTTAHFLIILIMGAIGALVRARFQAVQRLTLPVKVPAAQSGRKFDLPLPLIAALVVYGLIAFFAFKRYHLIFDISYHIVALFLMYIMLGWVWKRGAVTPRLKVV